MRITGRLYCPRCQLQIGYETNPGESKGVATFVLAGTFRVESLTSHTNLIADAVSSTIPNVGAITDVQNKIPADALGEPAITPAGDPKGVVL